MSGATDPSAWIERARQDARSARRLLIDPPELAVAAYHVQQAAEKAIKALLVAQAIAYPRGRGAGHDLDVLARLVPDADPLKGRARSLSNLTPWATVFRYPADDPVTVEPLPAKGEIARGLDEAEAFLDAVALRSAPSSSGRGPPG